MLEDMQLRGFFQRTHEAEVGSVQPRSLPRLRAANALVRFGSS